MRRPPGRDCRGRRRRHARSPSSRRYYAGRLRRAGRLGDARERQQVAGHARAAAVANDTLLEDLARDRGVWLGAAAAAAVELAALDDHCDVLVVLVVLDELRVELVGERLW